MSRVLLNVRKVGIADAGTAGLEDTDRGVSKMEISDQSMIYLYPLVCVLMGFFFVAGARTGTVSKTLQLPAYSRRENPVGYWISMTFYAAMFALAGYESIRIFLGGSLALGSPYVG
ncbi:MAG: hypothetical protein KGP14_13155 [Betaproteobacteria bacterium]|nr:hypothetical protein [Betaproteobacteria bacterium]